MPRYIEQLNTCTDPTAGDYFWIVDASAAAADKDRKVDVGRFAQKAQANEFTSNQTITIAAGTGLIINVAGSGQQAILANSGDFGAAAGPMISIGRNTNASTPAPGALIVGKVNSDGNAYLWPDDSGVWRTQMNAQVTSANRNGGTVVGTQTSSLDSKELLGSETPINQVLAAIAAGAAAVRRFQYRRSLDEQGQETGARPFGGEEFEGIVVDFASRYGMDRDADHPAGKSLNVVVAVGDLMRAVAWLAERELARGAAGA